ncbi:IclR family transcriptional regulator [Paenisporosarcina sp. TG20]|uniref:IclR family transcriptional regulator n=1 Tax=Paenisporosarcina sp. TG20 TaxID=1211706 RepID=UPI0003045B60|nr:IclR family transcriptional regulator [Paenisporosarcina sp. TG20]
MSKTIEKGLQLMELFREEKPTWRLDEIASKAQMSKSTTLRILRIFLEFGYLQRIMVEKNGALVEGETYSLGWKLLQLGDIAASTFEIRTIALPYMKLLQQEFNEAVQLVAREEDQAIYIEKVNSTRPVRLYTRVGRTAPLYAGACPRTLLAFMDDLQVEQLLEAPITLYANNTPKTKEEIWAYIKETRENGFSYSISELEEGTVSIAVPIFNRNNEVEFSISIAGIIQSLPKENMHLFLPKLWESAALISAKIGYSQPYPYGEYIQQIDKGEEK